MAPHSVTLTVVFIALEEPVPGPFARFCLAALAAAPVDLAVARLRMRLGQSSRL